ncbi:MAG: transposase [Cytophagales bacterium CG12_big_fil_rev_8_21_14_0_65_40_12]|nr:MAG: transposase [Cytophagales bacterium CG12_big_fil_rev_8_21_14_0_65_40_12]PIW05124.1 MAG: transposase [Cytophagales bacterium CG17_big_fil_post_rev_8_21_14_2_50_40_13]
MSTAYRFSENDIPHFVTMTSVEWIDIFNRQRYRDILIENLNFCIKNKGLIVHAYVIMSNHIHLIVRTRNNENLSSVIRDFKRYSAKVIYETLKQDQHESRKNWLLWIVESQGEMSSSNTHMKIWRHENHPIPLDRNNMFEERLNYIHMNPVRAGICFSPEDYVYSSAGAYAGEVGLVNIELV